MGLHAVGVILIAAVHLGFSLPRHGLSSAGRAKYHLVGSTGNLQRNSVLWENADEEVLKGEVVHSRSRRSTAVQYHYVSEPRVPRFTYERVYQKAPEPEPEPEPTPPPLPATQEIRRVLTEESHSRHDSEEHEEEHEEHEEHILEEYAEEMRRVQGQQSGTKQTPSRTNNRNPRKNKPRQPPKKKQEVKSKQGSSNKPTDKPNQRNQKSNPRSRRNKLKNENVSNNVRRPSPSSQSGVLVPYGQPILVYQPPPPLTFYDGLGLLHMSLGTSYTETLDLIRTSGGNGQEAWAIPVCDKFGQPLSQINVGAGQGNMQFVPIRGSNGHADWVYKASDDLGLTHYIHLKNKEGQLNLVNGIYGGKRTAGILGYDEGGQILIPVHFENNHFAVDKVVHATDYILL